MQILNFTEPLIKPALQARSKCFTIRKAWDWLGVGNDKKACWREQMECRHTVGALEKIMWNQRGKNGKCENCVFCDAQNRCIADAYAKLDPEKYAIDLLDVTECMHYDINELFPDRKSPVFSKVFGVGKILQTPKIHLRYFPEDEALECKEYDGDNLIQVAKEDGFKEYADFCQFFPEKYPIIREGWMPFWRVGWKWRVEL